MTLPASGGMTGAQIRTELGQPGGNLDFTPTVRWLADKPTGDLILPTDLYSKVSVKTVTGQRQQALGSTGSVTWVGMPFGIDYPGRVLVACTCLRGSGTLDQTSVTIGGVAAAGGDAGLDPGVGLSIGAGIWSASGVTGTSGNVTINFTSGTLDYGAIVMLSMSNAVFSGGSPVINGNGSSFASALTVPAQGIGLMVVANTTGNSMSLSGITKRVEMLAGSFAFAVCYNNKMAGGSTAVSGNFGAAAPYGVFVRSYTQ
ncbi:hypothetical protein [Rhizobium leguminosarum]|uniref:hypothetical protein n=1 Tax=Rhizobium leguminosarum TaxID=384 RepID=UPI00123760DC|nr:hypothetical protein [Rhizobium leguminosarum]